MVDENNIWDELPGTDVITQEEDEENQKQEEIETAEVEEVPIIEDVETDADVLLNEEWNNLDGEETKIIEDSSPIDIPITGSNININGVSVAVDLEQEKKGKEEWNTQNEEIATQINEIKDNPVYTPDGTVDIKATQEAIDNVPQNQGLILKQEVEEDEESVLDLRNKVKSSKLRLEEEVIDDDTSFNCQEALVKFYAGELEAKDISDCVDVKPEIKDAVMDNFIPKDTEGKNLYKTLEEYLLTLTIDNPETGEIDESINPETGMTYIDEAIFKAIKTSYYNDAVVKQTIKNEENDLLTSPNTISKANELQSLYFSFPDVEEKINKLTTGLESINAQLVIDEDNIARLADKDAQKAWEKTVKERQELCKTVGIFCEAEWYKPPTYDLINQYNRKIKEIQNIAKSRNVKITQLNALLEGKEGDYPEDLQNRVEQYQTAFTNYINEEYSKRLSSNKTLTTKYKEYGIVADKLLPDIIKQHGRLHRPELRGIDIRSDYWENQKEMSALEVAKQMFTNIKHNFILSTQGKDKEKINILSEIPQFEKGKLNIEENKILFRETTNKFLAETNIALRDFFGDRARFSKDRDNINNLIETTPVTLDMTIGEAAKHSSIIKGMFRYYNQGMSSFGQEFNENMTVKEFRDSFNIGIEDIKALELDDYENWVNAYEEMSFLKDLKIDEDFLSIEGFMQHLGMAYNQALHMVPSYAGQAMMMAGTGMSFIPLPQTQVASKGLMIGGGALMAAGASIQGAMTYSNVFMEGVRIQLTEELGQQPTAQQFFEALQDPKYGDQLAAAGAGLSVMGSEFFSDLIFSRVGGKAGTWMFTNSTTRKMMQNSLQKYIINFGTSAGVYGLNMYKEWGVEGFQEWLEQGFTHMAIGQDNPFTSNIDWDQISEAAEGGWDLSKLFGISTAGGALLGQSGISDIMIGSYNSRAKAIVSKLRLDPGSKTASTVEKLLQNLKNDINNDGSLNKKQKNDQILSLSNIRSAALSVSPEFRSQTRLKLINLIIEQKNLEKNIKRVNNKQASVLEIERKNEVDAQIQEIILAEHAYQQALQGTTQAMGIFGVGAEDPIIKGSEGKQPLEDLDALVTKWQQGAGDVDVQNDILPQFEAAVISSLKRWGVTNGRNITFDLKNPEVIKEIKQEVGQELWSFIENFDKTKSAATTYTANIAKRIGPRLVDILARPKSQKEMTAQEMENIAAQETEEVTGEEFQETGLPSSVAVVEKQLADSRPNILAKTKEDIKSFIASSLGKVKEIGKKGKTAIIKLTPTALAQSLVEAAGSTKTRQILAKDIGGYNTNKYKKFVKEAIEGGLISTIPFATMKKRLGTVPGFNIEKIGRETLGAGTGIYKLSGLQEQALIDFYTSDKVKPETRQGRYKSFVGMLAESMAIEQFQEMKTDKDFMKDLSISLEEAGIEMTAEEFIDQVEKKLDKRTKEKRSLDIIESKLDKGITQLDKYIKDNQGILYSGVPIAAAAAQAVRGGFKILKSTYQKTKSIAKAIKAAINYLQKKFKNLSRTKIKQIWETEVNEQSLKDNTIDIDALIDAYIDQGIKNKGIAYENVVYDAANKVKNTIFKVIGKQTEKGGAADFMSKLSGFDFNVEIKMETSRFGSVLMKILPNGNIKFATDYDFNPELEKALKKNKKNIQAFRNRAEQLGQNMEDFDNGIIDKKIWEQLKKEGYLKNARTIVTLDAKEVVGGYYLAQKYPSEYMNIKGKGLVALGNDPLGLGVPTLDGTVDIEVGINTSGTIYKKVKGKKPLDTGNRSFSLRAKPFRLSNVSKSNYNIDTTAGINKLLNSKQVQLLKDKQKAAAKGPGNNISQPSNSPNQRKETLENSLDTKVNAQKVNKKKKGISVFDMDDTLAKTKEQVLVSMPDGTLRRLTPAQFAEQADILTEQGAEFDFSQFEDVKGAKKGPLADLALRRQAKFGSGDIYVLTARPQASAQNIKLFLDSIGLNIPIENIIGLENGTPQAKAQWVLSKTQEGYNDFYFADDSKMNVKAVKQILDQVDVKSKVQQAIADKATNLDKEFNEMLEETEGVKSQAEYSRIRAQLEGKKKDKGFFKWLGKQLTITPSAEDFLGLMYDLIGSGRQGNRHAKWIRDNLINPFNKAEQQILSAKTSVANDFAALKNAFPSLKSTIKGNPLMDQIGVGPYTKSHAMRVYMWNKQGMEIPGLSKRDQNALVKAVENDMELMSFADNVILIQKDKQYPAPTNNWAGGTIDSDIMSSIDKTFRRQVMTEFDENTKIIFSEKNLFKLEATFGKKWVEALKDSLRRMKSGSNRPVYQGGGSRIVNELLDWLNGSVGAIMFVNMRSGLLQIISNINFINWGDNNIYAAAKAFASAEYWPTVLKLMNSDYLVNRRDGLKINVNEAELANAAKDGGMKGAINYLLDKGFIITRIMDSLAIATGGATFYINRRDALLKRQNPETGKKYTKAEAETQAFDDFYAIAEETQQSSNPSKISQQQASLAGRVILSFQNVTMQYNRKVKKAIRNLYNRRKNPGMTQRESDMSNISQIVYYTTVQNIIFHSLQQTLFALLFDDETEDEEKNRLANIANGMADSLLFGLGFGGAAISTIKNVLLQIRYESQQKSPEYEEAVWALFDFSPVLDSKVRKWRTGLKTFSWNREEIANRGWSLDNPAYLAVAQIVSATLNLPIDRVLRKTMNLRAAMDEETRTWQRIALILGWDTWSLGLPYWGLQSTIAKEEKEKAKIKADYKSDIRKIKAMGYKKVMSRVLKDYDPKDIIELQSPAGTVVYYAKIKKKKK